MKNKINYKYEIIYDRDIKNLNSIEQKIFYHNKNYQKYNDENEKNIIDLFTSKNAFYKNSNNLSQKWGDNIILETKADSKYNSVALASMMARGIFLEEIQKIEKKYNVTIPLGTNEKSIEIAKQIIEKHSIDELSEVCKTTFKTFKNLI